MRRHLLIVRHAKSAWDDPSVSDHDRPLAPRGANALPRLLDHLARSDHRPDLVLCSSSRRTVETLEGLRAMVPHAATVEIEPALYGASVTTLVALLNGVLDDVGCAMLVGHNPGMQGLALLLAGTGDADIRAQLSVKFPTAAVAIISFEGSWAELGAGDATLEDLFTPRPPRR